MSITNFNNFPGSDNLSTLPGVTFIGTSKLSETTRAAIEEDHTTSVPLTRGQKAAATRKANKAKREEEEYKVSTTTEEVDPKGIDQHAPGAKLDGAKIDLAVILASFPRALFGVGSLGMFGAKKYSLNGFLEVENAVHRYTSAGLRHSLQHMQGEIMDSETKLLHLSAVAWNAMAALEIYCRDNNMDGKFEVKSS